MIVPRSRKGIALKLHVKLLTAGTLTLTTLTPAACQGETRQLTDASLVRQIRPGQGVTMDFRQERVTIETDPQSGKITRASCG